MNFIDRTFLPRIDLAREADFAVGALRVRPSRREVEADGVCHVLQRRVMQVLVALAHPSAEVVSQDELISRCWGGLAVGEDAVGRCIGQLRRVAAGWPAPPFEITTIAGVGYRLDPAAIPPAPDDRSPEPVRRWRRGRLMLVAAALALAAVAGAWIAMARRAPEQRTAFRVVVAPLRALGEGANTRQLAGAVGDELLGVLGSNQIEALSQADAGLKDLSSAQDAARREVGLIFDGSAQDDGRQARVVIRLLDAKTRVSLWSAEFNKTSGAAQDLPAEVAARAGDIVALAQFALTASPPLRDDAALSALLEAHDLVRTDQSHNWARHLALGQQVVKAAPDFAFGHSMLALAYTYATRWDTMPQQKPEFIAGARSEAAKALALDPHDAGAYFALSRLEPGYARREAILAKGLSISDHPRPPLAALNNDEGEVLFAVGRLRDGLPFNQRSLALDPLSPVKVVSAMYAYAMMGRDNDAADALGEGLKRWPNHPQVRKAQLYFLTFYGRPEAALSLLDNRAAASADLEPEAAEAWRAYLTAMQTREPRLMLRTAASLAALADRGAFDRWIAAPMLSRLGAMDLAFEVTDHVAGEPFPDPRFLFTPAAAAMRRDPRFMPLAARLGLVDYWRATGKWPDFCAEPGLPYECARDAARLTSPAPVRQGGP